MSTREERYRFAGFIFYLSFLTFLLSTEEGYIFIQNILLFNISNVVVPLVALGTAIFTVESVGYLFNQLYISIWNLNWKIKRPDYGGYSTEWLKIELKFKQLILNKYNDKNNETKDFKYDEKTKNNLEKYSEDVYFSYFWQQAPTQIINWVSRRYSVFFTNRTNTIAIIFSTILSVSYINYFQLHYEDVICITIIFWSIILICFWYNARAARTEARHMVQLWTYRHTDDLLKKIFNTIEEDFSIKKGS